MNNLIPLCFVFTLASCTTLEKAYDMIPTLDQQLDACEAKGISRDVCYKVAMDEQRDIENRVRNK